MKKGAMRERRVGETRVHKGYYVLYCSKSDVVHLTAIGKNQGWAEFDTRKRG